MDQKQDYVGGRYGNGQHASSDELKRQVDHTRAEMDETIDALIARLDPAALLSRAVRGAMSGGGKAAGRTAGKVGRSTGHVMAEVGETLLVKAKENPIPTALIGLGVAWAMMSRNDDEEHYEFFDEYDDEGKVTRVRRRVGAAAGSAGAKVGSMGSAAGSKIGSAFGKAGSGMSRAGSGIASATHSAGSATSAAARSAASATSAAAHSVADATGSAASAIGRGAGRSASATKTGLGVAAHTIGDVTHDAAEGLRYTGEQIRYGAIRGAQVSRRTYKKGMRKAPLAVGGVALGLGILCGLIIPETRREDEMFGKTRDDLLDQGRGMAMSAKDRIRHMAEATAHSAMESLKAEGLTPSEISAAGQRVAESARKAAEEQLEKERATPRDLKEKLERTAEEVAETAEAEMKGESSESKTDTTKPEGFA